MKHFIKYIALIVISALFFIMGDIAVQGSWLIKLENTNYLFSHKIGESRVYNKFLKIKIVADNNQVINIHDFDGLQIQLMNSNYKELQKALVKNGTCQFDLSELKKSCKTLILIAPTTSNEMKIGSELTEVTMEIDASEIIIKKKLSK